MSYIGNQPTSTAFVTDTFSGNGTTTAFTMSVAPAGTTSLLVAITGVVQDPSAYSVTGTTLTFSAAPPSGTGNISVRYLGIPASGVTTTAYRTVTEFTATAGQTTFTPPSYTVGYLNVYRNGVLLGSADYTATNGTTVVLAAAASAGDLVTTESFYVSSVLNALPQTGGTLSGNLVVNGTETVSGNLGVGVSSLSTWGNTVNVIELSQGTALMAFKTGAVPGTNVYNNVYYDGTNTRYSVSGYYAGAYQCVNGSHQFYSTTSTGTAGSIAAFTQSFDISPSGYLGFNSGYGGLATAYGCRVWANFGYVGGVFTSRGSGGVSSITRSATGLYVINFSFTMPDTNYTVTTSVSDDAISQSFAYISGTWGTNNTTSKVQIQVASMAAAVDRTFVGVSIFR